MKRKTRAALRRHPDYLPGRLAKPEIATISAYLATVTFASIVTNLAISYAINYVVNAVFARRPEAGLNLDAHDRLLTVREPARAHDIVCGEVRKGGCLSPLVASTHTPEDVLTPLTHRDTIPENSPYTITVPEGDEQSQPHREAVVVRLRDYNNYAEEYELTDLTATGGAPASGEYSVNNTTGVYTFNAAQAGRSVEIVYKAKTDSKVSRYLHLVVVLAGHECEEIGDMYFDGVLVPLDADGNATGKYAGHVFVSKHLGTDDQTVDTNIQQFIPSWGPNYRGRGVCYAYVRLLRKIELFPNGVPNITFMVKGYKPYDPRTAASTWTPNVALLTSGYLTNTRFGLKHTYATEIDEDTLIASANIDDEEVLLSTSHPTAEFTADATEDAIYLTHGSARLPQTGDGIRVANTGGGLPGGLSAGTTYYVRRVAEEGFTLHTTLAGAYANTGTVNITSAGTGTHALTYYSEPRYTANGVISTSEKKQDILGRLKAARMGHIVRVGGKWKIRGGAYVAPELAFDEDGARGAPSVQTLRSRRESFNGVKGLYSSPDNEWQPSDFPPVQVDDYVTEDDGEERWFEIDLPLTSRASTAQRIGKHLLEHNRRQISAVYPMKIGAYRVEAGETVELSDTMLGWTNKVFEVAGGSLVLDRDADGNQFLGVDWTLQETDESAWDWDPEENEEPTERAEATNLPNPFDIAPPGKPVITEALYETREGRGVAVKMIASWGPSPDGQTRDYEFQWKLQADTRWQKQSGITDLDTEVLDVAPGDYITRVRAFNRLGGASDWAQTRKEIQGLGAAPETPTILSTQPHGNALLLTLAPAAALDVRKGGKRLVRHSLETVAADALWEESVSIGEQDGYPGDNTHLEIPLKGGVYLVKDRDSSRIESAEPAKFAVTQSAVNTYTTFATLNANFAIASDSTTGLTTDTFLTDGRVKLTGQDMWDDIADVDSVANVDSYGGVASEGMFPVAFGAGTGSPVPYRLTATLLAAVVSDLDNIDYWAGDIDDRLDFDGTAGSAADAWIEYRNSLDGGLTWTDWIRVDTAELSIAESEYRLQLRSHDPSFNIYIEQATVLIEAIT